MINLYDFQIKAIEQMKNGCILCGDVGSGKSITALSYYYLQNGGDPDSLQGGDYIPMGRCAGSYSRLIPKSISTKTKSLWILGTTSKSMRTSSMRSLYLMSSESWAAARGSRHFLKLPGGTIGFFCRPRPVIPGRIIFPSLLPMDFTGTKPSSCRSTPSIRATRSIRRLTDSYIRESSARCGMIFWYLWIFIAVSNYITRRFKPSLTTMLSRSFGKHVEILGHRSQLSTPQSSITTFGKS